MSLLDNLYRIIPFLQILAPVIGVATSISTFILYLRIGSKHKEIKQLQKSLAGLQKTYNDLDNQAKLIIKTDLELHKAQSELDKKITGLYTLQKISRVLSTTLDENEIFEKISEEYLTELGFDKVISFIMLRKESLLKDDLDIKLKIGYNENEINEIFSSGFVEEIFGPVIKQKQITSSLDLKIDPHALDSAMQLFKINSFVCAPIYLKEGIVGALFVGSESIYSPITLGDKEFVSILATQIGQSLENAKLFEETWRSHQDLERKVQQRTKELSKALEDIKIVTKRKSDFVSAVSHELRTPLTSIKGYAALLSTGKLGAVSPEVKQRLEKINKHSDDLSHLINNILDISRIESGRVEMKIEDFNLGELLDSLLDLLAPQFKEKQIDFIKELPNTLTIHADKDQLLRVFINLIGNALKFTPPQGKIIVRAKNIGEAIQIDVQDTGIGIAEKNLENIFEEFYREDNEINQNVKGTGLGLSLVKYIIEAHKGKIWVNSTLNKGSTFSFTLPVK